MKIDKIPWLVLGISLLVSTVIIELAISEAEQIEQERFRDFTNIVAVKIQDKFEIHTQVLLGFKGFFESSEKVEEGEFKRFFDSQRLE